MEVARRRRRHWARQWVTPQRRAQAGAGPAGLWARAVRVCGRVVGKIKTLSSGYTLRGAAL